jgi:aspartyl/asparaginyl beta-hydroxylase (cupin superfamily)
MVNVQQWLLNQWQQITLAKGKEGLERMQKMINVICGKEEVKFLTPGQQPYSFYLAGLDARPFHDARQFAFTSVLENNYENIKKELLGVITENKEGSEFAHYMGDGLEHDKGKMVRSGEWKVKYLYHNFERNEENCKLFPVTSHILDSLGAQILRGMVCFSAINPGTQILPHYGPSNMRLTCHLGIVGCQDVEIMVGNEKRHYENGKCVVFDDSFKHSVTHRGPDLRVTLMLDLWHPGMHQKEIDVFNHIMCQVMQNLDANHFFHSLHVYNDPTKKKNTDVS